MWYSPGAGLGRTTHTGAELVGYGFICTVSGAGSAI